VTKGTILRLAHVLRLLAPLVPGARAAETRRVSIVDSFSRDFARSGVIGSALRMDLTRRRIGALTSNMGTLRQPPLAGVLTRQAAEGSLRGAHALRHYAAEGHGEPQSGCSFLPFRNERLTGQPLGVQSVYATVAAARRWAILFAIVLSALPASVGATEANPRRMLLIHSFGRDVAPYAAAASVFRSELARGQTGTIAVYEVALDAVRTVSTEDDAAFVDLLHHRFAGSAPDIVVTFGAPAARFLARNRERLFPGIPVVISSVDERILHGIDLHKGDAAVVGRLDLSRRIDNILQLLPDTRTIAVVIGDATLDGFWLAEMQREVKPFEGRVSFVWLNDLTFEQMRVRVASLPPRTAVLFTFLAVDKAGVPFEGEAPLTGLHEVSAAPIFGLFESELGKGVVAKRILDAPATSDPVVVTIGLESPVYDWRELARWHIDEARLPAHSEVRFRPPSIWDEHRSLIVAALAIFAIQAALVLGLLWQRARRRRAEEEAQGLSGRLIDAHEDERRWLARELHDDITQRLARLAIEAGSVPGRQSSHSENATLQSIRAGLVKLSADVHDLSYHLHPSVLDDLGLVDALRAECDRVARCEALPVDVQADVLPPHLPRSIALSVYRVAQEALRNVVRHANASSVRLSIATAEEGIRLAVSDNGTGFDPDSRAHRSNLGHASMRERMRLVGGRLEIESNLGRGTTVIAWVPVAEASS
jgi:signal transduction histidine kinase